MTVIVYHFLLKIHALKTCWTIYFLLPGLCGNFKFDLDSLPDVLWLACSAKGWDWILKIIIHQQLAVSISLLFSYTGYYFNSTGLLACEPFFSKPSYRILATCAFYFPTTMVLMYCYGSSFHANRYRLATTASSAFVAPAAIAEKVITSVQMQATSCWRSWIKLNFSLQYLILHT